MDLKDIQALIQILKKNDINEFELEHDGTRIKLARGGVTAAGASPTQVATLPLAAAPAPLQTAIVTGVSAVAAPAPAESVNPNSKRVESPIVGTFYRRPSPDSEYFVKEGDRVRKGATLCIIEAMKVMNEIDAPCDGVIEKIIPAEGEVVEFGEVLFVINAA